MLEILINNNEAKFADAGGFVSPSGVSYIGKLSGLVCSGSVGSARIARWLRYI